MTYLYFNPKSPLKANQSWLHQRLRFFLQNCCKGAELDQIHCQMIRNGLIQDNLLASKLISFFTASPHLDVFRSHRILDQIPHPNSFTWNSVMRGYLQNDAPKDAICLYKQMLFLGFPPDNYTFPVVIKACSHLHAVQLSHAIHAQIVNCGFESDMIIMSGVVNTYVSCGFIDVAKEVFDEMPIRDVVSWTTIVSGYAQLNRLDEAMNLFDEMKSSGVQPNKVTLISLLSTCAQLKALSRGQWLHSYIVDNKVELDACLGNSLMNMYAKCGNVLDAVKIFESMPMKNTASWNVLIGGLVHCGLPAKALELFWEMDQSDLRSNEITIVSALSACILLGDINLGRLLHSYIKEQMINCDIFVQNALVNMYAKCGDLDAALFVFHGMVKRDVFSWTVMITGYVRENRPKEALSLFREMQESGIVPNEVTLVSLLSACGQLGALYQGVQIHDYIKENNVRQDLRLGNALVDMYCKCGNVDNALREFDGMHQKDIFSWNAMIGGLAANGFGRKAVELFSQMLTVGDIRPDSITFIAILCACSHSGLVREGLYYFDAMSSLYSITPRIEHYGCIVDLLCRAGLLKEVSNFIERMPRKPNHVIWGSLLAACRVCREVDLGEKAAKHIMELAPNDEGVYVLMSNMYAEARRWDDVRKTRALMDTIGIEKSPGFSCIEVNGSLHRFYVGDIEHHQYDDIYKVLDGLTLQLKELLCGVY